MDNFVMRTPVLFIIFNRPEMAIQVFDKIRQIRPPKLFIISDGARPDREGEAEKVQQCRAIKNLIDWDCDLQTDFSDVNMGCKDRISSGITWAFEQVEELIILEDDCVPDLTFFRFCQELLEKYRNDNRIMSVAGWGANICEPFEESYSFAKEFSGWGWATWKRAWNLFDMKMECWQKFRNNDAYFKNLFGIKYKRQLFDEAFQVTYEGRNSSWAYRFALSHIVNYGLCIIPKTNLVRNIGFYGGTHVSAITIENLFMNEPCDFPLIHPNIISPLDSLFEPPEQLNIKDIEKNSKKYLEDFIELLNFKQYHAILMLFRNILQKRDTFTGLHLNRTTWYHLRYAYFVAIAYYNLNDDEHAQAMADIASKLDFQKIDCLILKARSYFRKKDFESVEMLVSKIKNLPMNENQRISFENFCQSILQIS